MELRKGPTGVGAWTAEKEMRLRDEDWFKSQCIWETKTGGSDRQSCIQVEIFPSDFEEVFSRAKQAKQVSFIKAVCAVLSDDDVAEIIKSRMLTNPNVTGVMMANALIARMEKFKSKKEKEEA